MNSERPPTANVARIFQRKPAFTAIVVASIVGVLLTLFIRPVLFPAAGEIHGAPSHLRANQVLHLAWGGTTSIKGTQISAIDPGTASDSTVVPIVNLVFDGLVTLDQHLNVEKWGADTIQVSADGLAYTFHLRPGQAFSDGTSVHASDYVYAMKRSLDPCFQAPVNYYLSAIKSAEEYDALSNCVNGQAKSPLTSITADDADSIITITLAHPAAYFLDTLSYPTAFALERSVVTGARLGADETWTTNLSKGPTGQGGSGEFYVSHYDQAGNLILKRNPYWWGVRAGKRPYLTEIDYRIFGNSDTMYNTYLTDTRFDEVDGGRPGDEHEPDAHLSPSLALASVAFNWADRPFDSLDARIAFCVAINRTDITRNVLKAGQIATYHLVPRGMPGYDDGLTGPDGINDPAGNMTLAQRHWAAYERTQHGPLPKITFTVQTNDRVSTSFVEKLAAEWNQTFPGVNVNINLVEGAAYTSLVAAKQFQMIVFTWGADYPDPQDFLTLLYDTRSPFNTQSASVPAADRLMEAADAMSNPQQRMATYHQAEQLLVNNVAVCPIFQFIFQYHVRAYVHNYRESALGTLSLDQWNTVYLTTE